MQVHYMLLSWRPMAMSRARRRFLTGTAASRNSIGSAPRTASAPLQWPRSETLMETAWWTSLSAHLETMTVVTMQVRYMLLFWRPMVMSRARRRFPTGTAASRHSIRWILNTTSATLLRLWETLMETAWWTWLSVLSMTMMEVAMQVHYMLLSWRPMAMSRARRRFLTGTAASRHFSRSAPWTFSAVQWCLSEILMETAWWIWLSVHSWMMTVVARQVRYT